MTDCTKCGAEFLSHGFIEVGPTNPPTTYYDTKLTRGEKIPVRCGVPNKHKHFMHVHSTGNQAYCDALDIQWFVPRSPSVPRFEDL